MLKVMCVCLLFAAGQTHTDKLKTDAELQSALMPQELNPVFFSEKDSPLRAFFPLDRTRRDVDLTTEGFASLVRFKKYSRIVACVVLALSAATEIILYFIEAYYG